MGDIQVLKNALQWAIDNPGKHNQGSGRSCIIGHWLHANKPNWRSEEDFATAAGISNQEATRLFYAFCSNEAGAINYARELIAKYSPAPAAATEKDSTVVFEYVISDAYHKVTLDNEVEAKAYARGLKAAYDHSNYSIDGQYSIKIVKRPIVTSEEVPF